MASIRIFAITRDDIGVWHASVHREEESFIDELSQAVKGGRFVCIHVGFDRPYGDEIESLFKLSSHSVFLTQSAYHIFNSRCSVHDIAAKYGEKQEPAFLVIGGWGLTFEFKEAVSALARLFGSEDSFGISHSIIPKPLPEWLQHISRENTLSYKTILAMNIVDDESYLANEHLLPINLRILTGRIRFNYLSVSINPSNPIGLLSVSPPWIVSSPVVSINLTARLSNIFSWAGIHFLSDVIKYDEVGLLELPNFGKKSLSDLATSIRDSIMTNPERFFKNAFNQTQITLTSSTDIPPGSESNPDYGHSLMQFDPSDFRSLLDSVFAQLDPRRADVIKGRMGYGETPKTLDALGKALNISRERIRQYEQEFQNTMRTSQIWTTYCLPRILKILSGRKSALPLVGLQVFDPWFMRVDEIPSVLEYVLEYFGESKVYLINIEGTYFLSGISQEQWSISLDKAIQYYKTAPLGQSKTSIYDNFFMLLPENGSNLVEELFHVASKAAYFSNNIGDTEPILIAYGKTVEILIGYILEVSERPLHFSEVVERLNDLGKEVGSGRVNIALQKCALLVGSGTYALEKHLALNKTQLLSLMVACENLIDSSPDRQWHIDELHETIYEQFPEYTSELTPHILNIALGYSDSVKYLGRSVWISKQDQVNNLARIDVRQAIESILKDSGRPMTAEEIRDRLSSERGLGKIFQVIPNEVLIRVSKGCWGLFYRDVGLRHEDQLLIFSTLKSHLHLTEKGIHVSEIQGILNASYADRFSTVDPYLVFSLFQRCHGIKSSIGSYLFLEDWENSRRPTVTDTIRLVLVNAGEKGLPFLTIKTEASIIIGRDNLSDGTVQGSLKYVGATYEPISHCWSLVCQDQSIDTDNLNGEIAKQAAKI